MFGFTIIKKSRLDKMSETIQKQFHEIAFKEERIKSLIEEKTAALVRANRLQNELTNLKEGRPERDNKSGRFIKKISRNTASLGN